MTQSRALRILLLSALCLQWGPLPAWSQAPAAGGAVATPPPAVAAPAAPSAAPAPTGVSAFQAPLRIVVVHWKIKPGREAEFLEYWSTRSVVEDRSGLVGEYLSSIEDRGRAPWINWSTLDPAYVHYFNVGLWQDVDSFQSQIGRFIDNSRPSLPFEAARRERVFLVPERWRAGRSPLPAADPPGVK